MNKYCIPKSFSILCCNIQYIMPPNKRIFTWSLQVYILAKIFHLQTELNYQFEYAVPHQKLPTKNQKGWESGVRQKQSHWGNGFFLSLHIWSMEEHVGHERKYELENDNEQAVPLASRTLLWKQVKKFWYFAISLGTKQIVFWSLAWYFSDCKRLVRRKSTIYHYKKKPSCIIFISEHFTVSVNPFPN